MALGTKSQRTAAVGSYFAAVMSNKERARKPCLEIHVGVIQYIVEDFTAQRKSRDLELFFTKKVMGLTRKTGPGTCPGMKAQGSHMVGMYLH